jgi:hypothetical protein
MEEESFKVRVGYIAYEEVFWGGSLLIAKGSLHVFRKGMDGGP